MMNILKKIIYKMLSLFGLCFSKKVIIIKCDSPLDEENSIAIKSKFGFWYVGKITDTSDIVYGIANNGLIEEGETNLVKKILEYLTSDKDIVFYDIGANTGYYGILSAYLGAGKIKVFSFEPVKEHFITLQKNIKINDLGEIVKPFELALGKEVEELEINLSGSGSSLDSDFNGNVVLPKRKVQVTKMDVLFKENLIEKPDFIKMDVEGFELNVLEGGKELISKETPIIFVEIADKISDRDYVNKNYKKTIDFFFNLEYRVFCVEGEKIIDVKDGYEFDGVRMFLCLNVKKHDKIINYLKLYEQ